ncbi:VWA domain-containing protein [Chryseobacterium sp. GMJ5]|uniref:VWA domain-containing protein n=1 Tax=Chryseobacterium gilvum TaxID=2976534 RepID=A0ABT2W139_9FLAO|nr:VWA domain-containing protein [Chryseobacterium gilvum]MCU7614927.1 VWA domain-containing protein [Chryseobacterium gilvum]
MFNFEFYTPWFLALFALFIPLIIKDISTRKRKGIKVPAVTNMDSNKGILPVLFLLKLSKYIILSGLIIAMARPRTFTISQDRDETKGIDVMLAVDVSFSMFAKDFDPDRLSVLKKIAVDFIKKRPNDRIGLVTYKMEAFPKIPLTFDHDAVINELENIDPLELQDGTAVGEGLAVAVNHIKDSKAKSKIIILMTDGVSNIVNVMPPLVAAELAKNNNIKVYTIGIGTNGFAMMPVNADEFGLIYQEMPVTIDEATLREIAQNTGGKYFRATSNSSLEEVYNEINQLEKSDVKVSNMYHYEELFKIFLWIALGMLLFDAILRWVLYKFLS